MFRYASVLAAVVALCLTGISEAKGRIVDTHSIGLRPGDELVIDRADVIGAGARRLRGSVTEMDRRLRAYR